MQRMGGLRRKTRYLFARPEGMKGKIEISSYMQEFKHGDKVKLKFNPSVHISPFKPRHYGRVGVIKSKKGSCYEIAIAGDKVVVVHPAHLQRL